MKLLSAILAGAIALTASPALAHSNTSFGFELKDQTISQWYTTSTYDVKVTWFYMEDDNNYIDVIEVKTAWDKFLADWPNEDSYVEEIIKAFNETMVDQYEEISTIVTNYTAHPMPQKNLPYTRHSSVTTFQTSD